MKTKTVVQLAFVACCAFTLCTDGLARPPGPPPWRTRFLDPVLAQDSDPVLDPEAQVPALGLVRVPDRQDIIGVPTF